MQAVKTGRPKKGWKERMNKLEISEFLKAPVDKRKTVSTVASMIHEQSSKRFTVNKINPSTLKITRVA